MRLKLIVALLISYSLFLPGAWAQQSFKALFIGNSYTGVNNLPQLVANVAASTGDTLLYDASTPGGSTLQNHSTNSATLAFIAQGNYDYVVLQEQSQLPSFPLAQVQSQCFPYASLLDSLIRLHNPCAETVFYRTWGRKNGDAANCPNWPPVCTYAGMDSLLALRYQMMADDNDAFVAPVGEVWKYIRTHYPGIELYDTDESHPSPAGSYAAAVTFYVTFFRKDPNLISYDYTLLPWIAADIRTAVRLVVFDNLSQWNIGDWDPVAAFTVSYPGAWQASFDNISQNADQFIWDFGDGTRDTTGYGPVTHQYTAGSLPLWVSLTAISCQWRDTVILPVTPGPVGTLKPSVESLRFWPNPASDQILIISSGVWPLQCKILDMQGKVVIQAMQTLPEEQLDIGHLAQGVYILEISEGNLPPKRSKLLIHR